MAGSEPATTILENLHISDLEENHHYESPKFDGPSTSDDNPNGKTANSNEDEICTEDIDCVHNSEWINKPKHVFVLSSAGKPIYSRYGNEDKCAWLFGVMQTLVSFIQYNGDSIQSIHAGDTKFVFVIKKSLILVAVSKTQESVTQLALQLNYVFNQITSTLTLTKLNKIYEQRQNYDLRRLLTGVDRLIDHLLNFAETDPAFTLESVQCLSLPLQIRDLISTTIANACSKIKNLVFAILLANNRLITLVRMKKYTIHPIDLHLIFNLIRSSESFKTAESWTPICLPRFDASGYLYGHISYLADDCQACLLLLTVEKDVFFKLSEAKQRIVEVLRRCKCLEAINAQILTTSIPQNDFDFAESNDIRHFLYKCKTTNQYFESTTIRPPYNSYSDRLLDLYKRSYQYLHNNSVGGRPPLKLVFEKSECEAVLGWDTKTFELYVVFEPFVDTNYVINAVKKLLEWIKKREDVIFQKNSPTF